MKIDYEIIESPDQISGDFFLQLAQLDNQDFPNPWSLEGWKSFASMHSFLLVLLKIDLNLAGFILFEVQDADSFAHLLKIVVKNEFRGQKLGNELLNKSMLILEKKKIQKKFLEVEDTNLSAINLYEKFGFKSIHLNKNFYGPLRHASIMIKEDNY